MYYNSGDTKCSSHNCVTTLTFLHLDFGNNWPKCNCFPSVTLTWYWLTFVSCLGLVRNMTRRKGVVETVSCCQGNRMWHFILSWERMRRSQLIKAPSLELCLKHDLCQCLQLLENSAHFSEKIWGAGFSNIWKFFLPEFDTHFILKWNTWYKWSLDLVALTEIQLLCQLSTSIWKQSDPGFYTWNTTYDSSNVPFMYVEQLRHSIKFWSSQCTFWNNFYTFKIHILHLDAHYITL